MQRHLILKTWVQFCDKMPQFRHSEDKWPQRKKQNSRGSDSPLVPFSVRPALVGGWGTVSSLLFRLGRGPKTTTGLTFALVLYLVKRKLHEHSGTRRHELAPPKGDLCYLETLQNRKMCITK